MRAGLPSRSGHWRAIKLVSLALLAVASSTPADEPAPKVQFDRHVLPIFTAHCLKCHGLEGRQAELDLRTVVLALRGGTHGPAIVPGSTEKSLIFQKISSGAMPPDGERKLSPAQIDAIREWISGSGERPSDMAERISAAESPALTPDDRSFWSFRKLDRPPVPFGSVGDRPAGAIDAFLLAKLEPAGLSFSLPANRLTLMRRAYLDLLGFPPSPEEVDAYLTDHAPDAYERLIDRLLASPHYGERWARHWLDLAGYADTLGSDNDAAIIKISEGKWRYRDYVVRSFNDDKPYDRFLTEQLAGDELVDWRRADRFTPEISELLIATGFLRNAADTTGEPELNTAVTRYQVLHDTIQIATSSVLGLTVQCARCHSHKYDPVSQLDYYRLMAAFTPSLNPQNWLPPAERALPDVSPAEKRTIDEHNAAADAQVAEREKQLADLRAPYQARAFEMKLAAIPEPIRADTKSAIETPADQRSEIQKYLAGKFAESLKVKPEEMDAALGDADKATSARLHAEIATIKNGNRSYGRIQALVDVGPSMPTYLLRRGNYETPGPLVEPGFLSVLSDAAPDPTHASSTDQDGEAESRLANEAACLSDPNVPTTGRRLDLARRLTEPGSPAAALVARVAVNRIWQRHFGYGLVPTSDNFGRAGSPPSHPELLEWLAAEFIDSGWRHKHVHKLIMTSTAYRQSSRSRDGASESNHADRPVADTPRPDPSSIDPDNNLLWRQRLRRLESESIRDSILAVSGRLDRTMGGPPTPIENRPDGMVVVADAKTPDAPSPNRRSLYLLQRRNYQPTVLAVFDQPVLATNCTERTTSAVSLQSLTMLNDRFLLEQADAFARRVAAAAGPTATQRIELAFRIALTRPPTATELIWATELFGRQAERYLKQDSPRLSREQANDRALANVCHVLLNTSEFLYVD